MLHSDAVLILSPQAEEDFADILQYTLDTWGEVQTYSYRDILDKALLAIQQYPQIGHVRSELSPAHHRVSFKGQRGLCLPYPA